MQQHMLLGVQNKWIHARKNLQTKDCRNIVISIHHEETYETQVKTSPPTKLVALRMYDIVDFGADKHSPNRHVGRRKCLQIIETKGYYVWCKKKKKSKSSPNCCKKNYLSYGHKIRFDVVFVTTKHCSKPSKATNDLIGNEENIILF